MNEQNPQMIEKVVVLFVLGITCDLLSLPPLPTSALANPNLPLAISLLSHHIMEAGASQDEPLAVHIPFIASMFSHACPTRAQLGCIMIASSARSSKGLSVAKREETSASYSG